MSGDRDVRDLPVVVGVDDSEFNRAAVDLGITQARLHHRPLRLVHALPWPPPGVMFWSATRCSPAPPLMEKADRVIATARAHATAAGPELSVVGEVIIGDVVPVLLAEARRAAALVLGIRGRGGCAGLLIGSVALRVAAHAPGPVLVARGRPQPSGPVVVGVDGSPAATQALAFGFAEAAARDVELVALNTWYARLPRQTIDELPLIYQADDVTAEQARLVARAVSAVSGHFPQVRVSEQVRYGRAARILVDVSATAQLLVVGAHGRSGFASLLLGSVGQAVLHYSHCPVVIIRARGNGPTLEFLH